MNIIHLYHKISVFILHNIILYNQFNVVSALVGVKVRPARENEFPFVVSIMKISNDNVTIQMKHACMGTIVTRQDILTAEHCLRNLTPSGFKLKLGSYDLANCDEFYSLWWTSYNHWAELSNTKPAFEVNDIALIKTLGNLPNRVPAARIRYAPNSNFYGEILQLASWGKLGTGENPRVLHKATVIALSQADCENRVASVHGGRIIIHERRLCTVSEPHTLLHDGDSGGPLLHRGSVIAVNKGTCPLLNNDLHPDKVNIHFGTYFYRDFISDMMENHEVQF